MDYLLKSSAIIVLFYGFYKLILQRETFFQLNRLFLIIGIVTAAIIPFVVIPIYVEFQAPTNQNLIFTEANNQELIQKTINWIEVIQILYLSGVLLLSSKFIINFLSLSNLIIKNSKVKRNNYTYVKTDKSTSPFSFFNYIVFNPIEFKKNELEQIIIHEKVHANQFHSVDIIISQIAIILFWFNPFIWFYKKEIEQNLEFIADAVAQQKTSCEKSYQKLLLKSSLPKNQLALTNNFYNSLIKKRIIMLHKNRSKSTSQWKYLLILPLITAFIFTFNTKVVAQSKKVVEKIVFEEDTQMMIITKGTKKIGFDRIKKNFSKEGVTANFKNIKRNSEGEITGISISVKSKQSNANYSTNSDSPIKPIKISFDNKGDNISIGNSEMKHHDNDYFFVSNDGEHKIYSNGKGKKHIVLTEDHDTDNEGNVFIVKESRNNGKPVIIEINEEIHEDGDKNIEWITESDNNTKIEIIKRGDHDGNVFISELDDNTLYFINGKKSSKKAMENLNPSDIEKVTVLKGDSAIKKYGGKAKAGVIQITTKKK